MAEAIARNRFRDIDFASAGTHAVEGNSAFGNSVAAAGEVGADLGEHRARLVTEEMMSESSRVYALDVDHLSLLADRFSSFADKVELLDPSGRGIEDPFGSDIADHRRVRDRIVAAIEVRGAQWRDEAASSS